jgi:hypothetical protein
LTMNISISSLRAKKLFNTVAKASCRIYVWFMMSSYSTSVFDEDDWIWRGLSPWHRMKLAADTTSIITWSDFKVCPQSDFWQMMQWSYT